MTHVNASGHLAADFVSGVMEVSVIGWRGERSSETERTIFKGNIDICNLTKGVMGGFISLFVSSFVEKYSNMKVVCPMPNGYYYLRHCPFDIERCYHFSFLKIRTNFIFQGMFRHFGLMLDHGSSPSRQKSSWPNPSRHSYFSTWRLTEQLLDGSKLKRSWCSFQLDFHNKQSSVKVMFCVKNVHAEATTLQYVWWRLRDNINATSFCHFEACVVVEF